MSESVESLLDCICGMIAKRIDIRRLADARRRHADVLAGRQTDCLPLVFNAPPPEARDWPRFGWDERFHDPDKSLFMQLRENVLPAVCGNGDCCPGVRGDLGVIICMSVFGVKWQVTRENRSIVTQYVPKDALAALEVPEDVSALGVLPRMIEHMEHHRRELGRRGLGGLVDVYHCDQQGPFDIAAQTRGHEIFVDLYEDGDFVRALMAKCADAYVKVTRLCKAISGERIGGAGNAVGVWMEAGAVRMCGDSDILVGAEAHREFIQPYQRAALEALGGGWLHYCGGWEGTSRSEGLHLHESYAEIASLRGLNWTTARDWMGEMRKLRRLGVAHIGQVPRGKDEPLEAYFLRALEPYEDRAGFLFQWPDLRPGEHERAVDVWRCAQDEKFG
jgi:hypothetical protein